MSVGRSVEPGGWISTHDAAGLSGARALCHLRPWPTSSPTRRSSGPRPAWGRAVSTRASPPMRGARNAASACCDAGLQLYGTEGYAATTIAQLCHTAGVAPSKFYVEFSGREELLAVLCLDIVTEVNAAMVSAVDAEVTLSGQALAGLRASATPCSTTPGAARTLLVEGVGVSAELERHRRSYIDQSATLLIDYVRALAETNGGARRGGSPAAHGGARARGRRRRGARRLAQRPRPGPTRRRDRRPRGHVRGTGHVARRRRRPTCPRGVPVSARSAGFPMASSSRARHCAQWPATWSARPVAPSTATSAWSPPPVGSGRRSWATHRSRSASTARRWWFFAIASTVGSPSPPSRRRPGWWCLDWCSTLVSGPTCRRSIPLHHCRSTTWPQR